ncbi:hypothetical protein ACLVWU_10305 [Bdellovibrio sp. HCB290]|uniref:hypothetical protein n=1 Tax=Bdellovibrio sp. HCB290 TaxID=3394356 RepID=UPI0039B40D5E
MRQAFKILTAVIALNSLAACATSPQKAAQPEQVTVWEVSESPFLRAVKKTIPGDKTQDITSQMPAKSKQTKTQ